MSLQPPSFRNSAMHLVAIVPLSVSSADDGSQTDRSFPVLLQSLGQFASSSQPNDGRGLSLIVPHSQLSRPGDWQYQATPLPSHDWHSGAQRLRLFDGRLRRNSYRDPWRDLEPHRAVAAVLGVLSLKDCRSTEDLWRAEDDLLAWAHKYSDNARHGDHSDLLLRIFLLDSFEDNPTVDLNHTHRIHATQIVAFPPIIQEHLPHSHSALSSSNACSPMITLHWNVVVNDLAVALFTAVEQKIRENDLFAKTLWKVGADSTTANNNNNNNNNNTTVAKLEAMPRPGESAERKGTSESFSSVEQEKANTKDMTGTNTATDGNPLNASTRGAMGVGDRFKKAVDITRKVIGNHRQDSENYYNNKASVGSVKRSSGHAANKTTSNEPTKLVTPIDLDANSDTDNHHFYPATSSSFSPKDNEARRKRELARREKRSADLSLLAGSPIDAYERYTRAAELTRNSHDPLWYASALEGCACSFIAMADVGGHGVDEYLESNFQLPEEIMALAIAQGVASGADLGDAKGKTMTVDRTKTTMPQAVLALVEEALSVLCRHEKLAPLYAGLLLKLAEYVQEEEEGHLRCRWGEGEYGFRGDLHSMAGECLPPRWERTSVSKLNLLGTEVRGMLALDSIERGRKFIELLHRAVSVGGLDDYCRADVALASSRACLIGMKKTQWGDSTHAVKPFRLRFPRKAAFFTIVAAKSLSRSDDPESAERASQLFLGASYLFSRKGNLLEHGGDVEEQTRYGWATLRIEALRGLSMQSSDLVVAEAATELLIALLNEIASDKVDDSLLLGGVRDEDGVQLEDESQYSNLEQQESKSIAEDSKHGKEVSTSSSSSAKPKQVSKPLASMTSKTPFFSQAPPSALSLSQSKWLEDDPIPHINLPIVDDDVPCKEESDPTLTVSASPQSMKCVIPEIPLHQCSRMQQLCIEHIQELRQKMSASTGFEAGIFDIYGEGYRNERFLPPPLVVTSAKIVKAEAHLILERTKALGYTAKLAAHSMSTFYNPYAKYNKGEKEASKVQPTLIAEGEERTIMIEFKNRLAIPLEVQSCVLEFEGNGSERIEAPPLSFTVPAKTASFAVHFPFIIAVSKVEPSKTPDDSQHPSDEEGNIIVDPSSLDPNILFVSGLRATCLNRTFPLRFSKGETGKKEIDIIPYDIQLPPEASRYHRSKHTRPAMDKQQLVVQLESVPAQPNLLVSFATSQSPMLDEDASVPVHLSDGEIFTIPPFRLENDFGRSGMGEIERLQIVAVGLPGVPDELLLDTDVIAASLEKQEDILTESDSETAQEDFEEMMECDGLPPLKMKVIAEGLNLRSINDKSKNKGEGSIVTFQIAATHDMGDQLANGGNVRIRFRYRGPYSNPVAEIWRKREISLRIIRVKGPRISSLTFRSDLSWGSSYSELCKSLSIQRQKYLDTLPKWENRNHRNQALSRDRSFTSKSDGNSDIIGSLDDSALSILTRVGKDQGVHVSSDEVVLLIAVANETNSTIILSNRKGLVGGFEGSPMPTVKVTSGVSVKIPVVIPRIDRMDENGEVTDIAAELVTRTALHWESEIVEGADGTDKIKRTGRVRIPSRCLREIIEEHRSFASRICKPPVSVHVSIGSMEPQNELLLSIGSAIQVDACITIQDWVPAEVAAKCKFTIQLCCAEKQPGNKAFFTKLPYVWCGQVRRTINLSNDDDKCHSARIAFFQCGVFVVSACAHVSSQDSPSVEECWWAPHAKTIRVDEKNVI